MKKQGDHTPNATDLDFFANTNLQHRISKLTFVFTEETVNIYSFLIK